MSIFFTNAWSFRSCNILTASFVVAPPRTCISQRRARSRRSDRVSAPPLICGRALRSSNRHLHRMGSNRKEEVTARSALGSRHRIRTFPFRGEERARKWKRRGPPFRWASVGKCGERNSAIPQKQTARAAHLFSLKLPRPQILANSRLRAPDREREYRTQARSVALGRCFPASRFCAAIFPIESLSEANATGKSTTHQ
jgi:hypothetical protein